MDAALVSKIESGVERTAASLFAAACGYAAYRWLSPHVPQPALGAEIGGAAALAYLCAIRALRTITPTVQELPVPIFDLREYEIVDQPPELLLTERYQAPVETAQEPLELDDVLAEIDPDSRVVRLFDPGAVSNPGQLKERVDRHLRRRSATPQDDATEALHEALAELRRSIR